jgi:hypothetical protein
MNAFAAHPVVRLSAFAGAAIAALVLLIVFHAVVAGAVAHATERRAEAEAVAVRVAAARWAVQPRNFATRGVSLVGASD